MLPLDAAVDVRRARSFHPGISAADPIVTGAAAGTGRAIARRLATEGAAVVVADIDRENCERIAREIGGRFVRADMRSPDDVRALIADAEPQILVNNAGVGGHVPPDFPEAEPDGWGATLDLNLRGPMLATQLALEPMRRQGEGAVVNIASSAGLGTEPYVSPEYGAAKAGLIRDDGRRGHVVVLDG